MKILANDGISASGIAMLEKEGYEVITTKVAQEQLTNYINTNHIEVLLVRSATKVRKDVIDACKDLKIIGRGGVGTDNIDVEYALQKGIRVVTTPKSSSRSVAELVFAHLLSGVRYLFDSNRNMPLEGDTRFNELKKSYSKGAELYGKTLGIIGLGRVGQEVAKLAIAMGMKVVATDFFVKDADIKLDFFDGRSITFNIATKPMDEWIADVDFISIHIPAQKDYLFTEEVFAKLKKGVGIINTSRGGIIDEVALTKAIDDEIVSFAGLDVYNDEPHPAVQILMNPQISLTPHTGASTIEAQERIGQELAEQIIEIYKSKKLE